MKKLSSINKKAQGNLLKRMNELINIEGRMYFHTDRIIKTAWTEILDHTTVTCGPECLCHHLFKAEDLSYQVTRDQETLKTSD